MKLSTPLQDIILAPGKLFDPASSSEKDIIDRIRKIYCVIAEIMYITVLNGMVEIEFRNATPEKFTSAMKSLKKSFEVAGQGRLSDPPKYFQEVLTVIPENVAVRSEFADATLADLYDSDAMPKQLLDAHRTLDTAVDLCYRPAAFKTELERLRFLFDLYRNYTEPLIRAMAKPPRKKVHRV
jgi:hypothetical protein